MYKKGGGIFRKMCQKGGGARAGYAPPKSATDLETDYMYTCTRVLGYFCQSFDAIFQV